MTSAQKLSLAIAIVMLLSLPVLGHELFLKPKSHVLAPGTTVNIELVNGTYTKSDNVVTRDRMLDVSVHGGGKSVYPPKIAWRDTDRTSVLVHRFENPGTYMVGVSTKARILPQTAKAFTDYLRHEGVTDTLNSFDASAHATTGVRERYSKHVKTLLQVGAKLTDDHKKVLDYPVEIVLEDNPFSADPGQPLSFKVLRNGAPLAGQLVYARLADGGDNYHGLDDPDTQALTLRTDADGRAAFTPSDTGVWYLTLIHMQKTTDDPYADYESNWATLTFQIGQ